MTDLVFAETQGTAGAPLVFTFHGTGGSERQFHDFAQSLIPGAHVISSRGTVNEHGALRYFKRTGEGVYDMDDLRERTQDMARFLSDHKTRLGADRVVGLGYSNGANILMNVMLEHPDIFTDAMMLHPLIPWSPAPQPGLAQSRILITAGEMDPICPAQQTRALIAYLEQQGADVRADWHSGGHNIMQNEVDAITDFCAAITA